MNFYGLQSDRSETYPVAFHCGHYVISQADLSRNLIHMAGAAKERLWEWQGPERRALALHVIVLSSRAKRGMKTKRGVRGGFSYLEFEFQLCRAFGFVTIDGDLSPQLQGHGAIQDACQKPALICIISHHCDPAPKPLITLQKHMCLSSTLGLCKSMESLSVVPSCVMWPPLTVVV